MINPNDINLIIFDLGGTLISDIKPVYEAVKRAFSKLGWEMPCSEAKFSPYMVMPSDEFYQAITPPEKQARWQEAREKIWEEYHETFLDFAAPYPGVIETLGALKKRGFRLAVYSRASSRIITDTITKLDMKNYFVYMKTTEDDALEKIELARKIIEKFDATAAIVGDSSQDIEVAKTTNSLSIGVLYGYGDKEPKKADIGINKFNDLLSIFKRNEDS